MDELYEVENNKFSNKLSIDQHMKKGVTHILYFLQYQIMKFPSYSVEMYVDETNSELMLQQHIIA